MSISPKWTSRKLWASILGALLPLAASFLTGEIDLEKALQLSSAIIISYVFGQGAVDAMGARAAGPTLASPEDPEA